MHDLARAYKIPVKLNGTKPEILPALIAAEQQGIFKGPAAIPYYLKKAAWNSDRPFENTDWGNPPKDKRPKTNAWQELIQEAKSLGVGKVGMNRLEYEQAIKEAKENGSSGGSTDGAVDDESLQGVGT